MASENNKRIAKNTILLYVRMLFVMAISFYTSRLVLIYLGVEDFGIHNVVGGIVSSFAFLNGAMASSTQRYLTFEIENKENDKLKIVFSTSVIIHTLIALLIVILAETVGLWLFYSKLNIPESRMIAAFWVYQFAILNMMILIITVPYNALIIAHERMKVFAYFSIVEVVLKLIVVFLLGFSSFDTLIFYAFLYFTVQFIIRVIYIVYSRMNFKEAQLKKFTLDFNLMKEMASFAGWNLVGNFIYMTFYHGTNILLNIFFGPLVNAAWGVSVQVQGVVSQFFVNFQTALNPQITKSYASNNLQYMYSLIYRSTKFTFFLLFLICIPLFIEANQLLSIWLKEVPTYSVIFLRLILISTIFDAISNPLIISAMATGKVKFFELIIGAILFLILPFSYLVLKSGGEAYTVFLVHIFFAILAYIARLIMINKMINLPIREYFETVLLKCIFVVLLSTPVPIYLKYTLEASMFSSLLICIISVLTSVIAIYFVGLDVSEKSFIKSKIVDFKYIKK